MGLQLGTQNHQVQQSKRTFLFSKMDVEKELFAAYAFYAGIVTLKMLMMSPLTTRQRLFVGARVLHTIVYLFVIPQPARALTFFANLGVNIYMAYRIIVTFM